MRKFRMLALILALCLLLGVFSACGSQPETPVTPDDSNETTPGGSVETPNAGQEDLQPQKGGHLDVHVVSTIIGLDPHKDTTTWRYMYMACIYEPALVRDADNQIKPGICEYEVSEDGCTVTMWPREGAIFHDGTPVEAEDVIASIQRACNFGVTVKEYLAPHIKEAYTQDGKAIIVLDKNDELAWSRLASYQTWAAVMPKEICEKYADTWIMDPQDAIGTGPYKVSDFETMVQVTIERFEDYTPWGEGNTGFAGPKLAYMDSMSFWYNGDYNSSTLAVMAGEYDITDVIEPDYVEMAADAGVVRTNHGIANNGFVINFNNGGGENVCAKYPDLRKAIMAAINMPEWAAIVTDDAIVMDRTPVLESTYNTDIFTTADWYGAPNQEAVDKYLAAARAAGYKDEPIRLISSDSGGESWTLLCKYFEDAGISYKMVYMDAASASEMTTNPHEDWDLKWVYPTLGYTPTTLGDVWLEPDTYVSADRDAVLAELRQLEVGSDAYIAKWEELAQLFVDECSVVSFGVIDWYWNHNQELHCDYEGVCPYFFNSWWENPETHN